MSECVFVSWLTYLRRHSTIKSQLTTFKRTLNESMSCCLAVLQRLGKKKNRSDTPHWLLHYTGFCSCKPAVNRSASFHRITLFRSVYPQISPCHK